MPVAQCTFAQALQACMILKPEYRGEPMNDFSNIADQS